MTAVRHAPRSPLARGRRPAVRAGGFSLIEVLAAFVILSLVATALFGLFGGALRNLAAADDWNRAVLVAESRLAAAASIRPLREAVDRGDVDDGRIKWETRVSPYDPPVEGGQELGQLADAMPTRLWRVEVFVTFPGLAGGERAFALATLRLGERNPS
jgi:general secretion pathway protein I